VLCVGRIEPRKNQLALIEALRGTDIPLTLVGDAGRFSRRYYERCRRAAEGGGGSIARSEVRFLPGQPVEALPALYHGAEVHACVSWYETPGLVNLEAALCGCAIVATRGGSTPEYLGEDAHYADPGSPERIRGAVEGARRRGASRELAQRVRGAYTWDAAAARTIEGYRMALKAHR
jgi:glycosyltransferase involved in cell wall biosynthesis